MKTYNQLWAEYQRTYQKSLDADTPEKAERLGKKLDRLDEAAWKQYGRELWPVN